MSFPNFLLIMNIMIWNSKGALKPNFQSYVRKLAQNHDLAIMVIMETKIGGEHAKEIMDQLPFDMAIHTETIGYAGGLWLLWNSDRVEVSLLSKTKQEIHVTVKVCALNFSWLFSAVYASPRIEEMSILWNNLFSLAELQSMAWFIARDFNEPLLDEDKFGGRNISLNRSLLFKDYLDKCNMIDLGFLGPRFTWTNGRELSALIQERIDKFFVNPNWCSTFPEARVSHLTRCHSDHCPVLLETPTVTFISQGLSNFRTVGCLTLPSPRLFRVPGTTPNLFREP